MTTTTEAALRSRLLRLRSDAKELDAALGVIAAEVPLNPRALIGRAQALARATEHMIGEALKHHLAPPIDGNHAGTVQ